MCTICGYNDYFLLHYLDHGMVIKPEKKAGGNVRADAAGPDDVF